MASASAGIGAEPVVPRTCQDSRASWPHPERQRPIGRRAMAAADTRDGAALRTHCRRRACCPPHCPLCPIPRARVRRDRSGVPDRRSSMASRRARNPAGSPTRRSDRSYASERGSRPRESATRPRRNGPCRRLTCQERRGNHRAGDCGRLRRPAFGQRAPIPRGNTGIPTRASLSFNGAHKRRLSLLPRITSCRSPCGGPDAVSR
jgi:hypothetical protein